MRVSRLLNSNKRLKMVIKMNAFRELPRRTTKFQEHHSRIEITVVEDNVTRRKRNGLLQLKKQYPIEVFNSFVARLRQENPHNTLDGHHRMVMI